MFPFEYWSLDSLQLGCLNIGLSHRLGHDVEEKEKMCYEDGEKR